MPLTTRLSCACRATSDMVQRAGTLSPSMQITLARLALIVILVVVALLAATTAFADVGPKPTMQFKFVFQIAPVALVSGQQIECSDAGCSDAHPLAELGPQRFTCAPGTPECSSL